MVKVLSPQYIALFIGGAAAIGAVLILAAFLLQKSLGRNSKRERPKSTQLTPEDESTFTLTTVKSVVTQLKSEQQTMQEQLRAAERRAETGTRHLEILAREIPQGLLIFDLQGYISYSNSQVRSMLAIDTWSRRRYAEILKEIRPLPEFITLCFEGGNEVRGKVIDFKLPDRSARRVETSVFPSRNNAGGIESVVCIFKDITPDAPLLN